MTSRALNGLPKCQALPISWLYNTEPLLVKATEYTAVFPLSIADAWNAACASEQGAVLLSLKSKKIETR